MKMLSFEHREITVPPIKARMLYKISNIFAIL